MTRVSNNFFCDGGAITNIGYYYRIVFPNVYDESVWCFRTPADFGSGGVTLLDG